MILFAAIKIPQDITRALSRLQKGVSGARWSAPEKFHITLGYFGDIDDDHAEVLDYELARIRMSGFELELSGAGHFGSSDPHAIWVGVTPHPALTMLHDHCRQSARRAKVDMEKRNYVPHVTLAYMKPFSPIDRVIAFEQRLSGFKTPPFLVDEFFLMSSHRRKDKPNKYYAEASYPLIGG